MLSRVANNLYWFSRYVRRVENTSRLLGACCQLRLDLPRQVSFDLMPVIAAVGAEEGFSVYSSTDASDDPVAVLHFLALSLDNPSSLRSSLNNAREILRSVRDVLPQEVWDAVNDMHGFLEGTGSELLKRGHEDGLFTPLVDSCLKISGLLSANVSRDIGFHFLRLGAALEQADMTSRIIDAGASGLIRSHVGADRLEPAYRSLQWAAVLSALAGMQMFRRQVHKPLSAETALGFLLQDTAFPRSVYYCLSRLLGVFPHLPWNPVVERQMHRVVGLVRNADPAWQAANNPALLMDEIQLHVADLDAAIAQAYFRG